MKTLGQLQTQINDLIAQDPNNANAIVTSKTTESNVFRSAGFGLALAGADHAGSSSIFVQNFANSGNAAIAYIE